MLITPSNLYLFNSLMWAVIFISIMLAFLTTGAVVIQPGLGIASLLANIFTNFLLSLYCPKTK